MPVFLRLSDYAGDQEVLIAESAVGFAEAELQLKMSEGFFEDALNSGRCLVCLDAMDEIPADKRYRIVRRVEQLARRYRKSRFIITSRIAGYDNTPLDEQIFTRYVAQPMDDDGKSDFIDRQLANGPERAQNLKDLLEANPGIKSLVSNPMLMTILNLVYREGEAGVPLNRAKFYERAVKILVKDGDNEDSLEADDLRHEALLTEIALLLHDENRETIGRSDLKQRAAKSLLEDEGIHANATRAQRGVAEAGAEAFIQRAERRTGLLVEQRPGSGVFRFAHATFREYLTAKDIHDRHSIYDDEREACWQEIKGHLGDARWREVILLLLGSVDDRYCTYLTESILDAGDEFTHSASMFELPTHLQMAAEALANQAPMSLEVQQRVIGRLERVPKAYTSEPGLVAVRALEAVRHLPELVNPTLTAIATDPAVNAPARGSAAAALGRLGETDTAIASLSAIATDPAVNAPARVSAAAALGRLGELDAAIATLTAIATDPAVDTGARVSAGEVLGDLGEMDTAEATLRDITADPAVQDIDRMDAALILERWGKGDVLIATLIAIATDPAVNPIYRFTMARMLMSMDEEDTGIATLTAIATDSGVDVGVRLSAAEFLEFMDETDTAKATLAAIATNPAADDRTRVSAAEVLGSLGETDTAKATARDIATDPAVDARDRVSAAAVLGNLGETDTAKATVRDIATDAGG